MKLRKPLLAGQWYPGTEAECLKLIKGFIKEKLYSGEIKGGIVPHAGWYYSGEIAAGVFEAASFSKPDLVIVFGMHMYPGQKIRVMSQGGYDSPLGPLYVDEELVEMIEGSYSFERETPDCFEEDNTIEVQLPFIKYFMGEAAVFGAGLPPDRKSIFFARELVSKAVEMGRKPVVIGSTDLTHYGPAYGFTPFGSGEGIFEKVEQNFDRKIIDHFLCLDAEGILKESSEKMNACCSGAAAGAAAGVSVIGATKGFLMEYSNSYKKTKGDNFVGYAGVLFS